MKRGMNHISIRTLGCFALFIVLAAYFTVTYSYYPGMSIGFNGSLERSIRGKLYWDYGDGFTDLDYIPVTLSAEDEEDHESLGDISVEASGLKNDKSRDHMVWLVMPEELIQTGDYSIEGKHQWMHWLTLPRQKRNNLAKKGRQLALFPGSKIWLQNTLFSQQLYFFKTPDSGIVRISSENGPERFFDGYGKNRRLRVSNFLYSWDVSGQIDTIKDPFRQKKLKRLPLPHQKIRSIKFKPVKEDLITGVRTIDHLIIRPSSPDGGAHNLVISSIKINGKRINAGTSGTDFNLSSVGDHYVFDSVDQYIEINHQIYSFEIEYLSGNNQTSLLVQSNGAQQLNVIEKRQPSGAHLLQKQAEFEYLGLTLESLEIEDAQGSTTLFSLDGSDNLTYHIEDLREIKQRQFNPLLFSVQLATAAITALVCYWLSTLLPFERSKTISALVREVFLYNGRWLFWLLFFTGCMINLIWLSAEWPGSLTPDSVHVHSGLKQLKITNHHPYLYSLFILGLYNIYDSPLTVIIFQILSYNGLVAGFMYVLYKNGIKWWVILPLCSAIFLLIPVNLFNMTVWKDIPFTTLLLFWVFFITICYHKKIYTKTPVELSNIELILLALLFLSLCTFRHNGVIYIIFIPVYLFCFSTINRYWLMKFFGLSAALFVLYYIIVPPYVLYNDTKKNSFAGHVASRTVERAAEITGKRDGYFLEHYLADRMRIFISSLGTSPKASTWYNDMNNPPQRWFSVDELRSVYKTHPPSEKLEKLKNKLLQSREYQGFTKGRFLHWNSLFSLLGLILIFLLYKWLPLSALYSSFFLFQTAALFFVVWARWRYMYFLYLGGFFLLFVILLELQSKKRNLKKQMLVSH